MDAAQARLKDSKVMLDGLATKLSEIEINGKRDIEHFKERNSRETKEKIELLAEEMSSRLTTEKHNFHKRLNNEAAQNLVALTKSKVNSDKATAKQLNDLSIELLGNP
jgi:F0F1-type ATP synthase membrane subunit b/b'